MWIIHEKERKKYGGKNLKIIVNARRKKNKRGKNWENQEELKTTQRKKATKKKFSSFQQY